MWRKLLKSNQLISGIDATAFSTIMIMLALISLLLIWMMARSPHRGTLDLPRVSHPVSMLRAEDPFALRVALLRDGQIYFRNRRVTIEELPEQIRAGVDHGAERKVYTSADSRARYEIVKKVIDAVQSAQVENLAFLVDRHGSIL